MPQSSIQNKGVQSAIRQLLDLGVSRAQAQAQAQPQALPAPAASSAEDDSRARSTSIHYLKNALNGGEMSPQMGMRFDQQRFTSGCHELLNMIPLPCGGVTKRPGMRCMGLAGGGQYPSRLVPFIFSAEEARMLEIYPTADGAACALKIWLPDGSSYPAPLKLPFKRQWLKDICFCQSADVIYCAHRDLPPGKIMRYSDLDWRYQTIKFAPAVEPPVLHRVYHYGWLDSENRRTSYEYCATAIDAETGEESEASASWRINGTQPNQEGSYCSVEVKKQPGVSEFRIYRLYSGVFGYVGRIECEEDDGLEIYTLEDKGITPDTEDTPPKHKNPFDKAGDYPAICFMYQQRLGFAASYNKPLTVWLSPNGSYESMAASVPPEDDDAIEATLAAPQANRILWAVPDRMGVALGTTGNEWMLTASDSGAVTPKNISFQPQTSYGSKAGISPINTGSSMIFCQRGGTVVRNLGYNFSEDRYLSADLTLLARHILKDNPVNAWAWQAEPYGIVWLALNDGTMAGLTYLAEHEIIAWHRHETCGFCETLASMPDAQGDWQLWLEVVRPDNKRYIEKLDPIGEADKDTLYYDGQERHQFEARLSPCIGEVQQQNGSSFLNVKKLNMVKFRVLNSYPFKCRVKSQGINPSPVQLVPPRACGFTESADWASPLASGFRDNARLEIIADGPKPLTILGLTVAVECGDLLGSQK